MFDKPTSGLEQNLHNTLTEIAFDDIIEYVTNNQDSWKMEEKEMAINRDFIEVTVLYLRDEKTRKLLGCNLVMADGTIYKTIIVGKTFEATFSGLTQLGSELPIPVTYTLREANGKDHSRFLILAENRERPVVYLYDGQKYLWSLSDHDYFDVGIARRGYANIDDPLRKKLIDLGISPNRISVQKGKLDGSVSPYEVFYTDAVEVVRTGHGWYNIKGASYCVIFAKDEYRNTIKSLSMINVASSVLNDVETLKQIARLVQDVVNGRHRRQLQKPCKAAR